MANLQRFWALGLAGVLTVLAAGAAGAGWLHWGWWTGFALLAGLGLHDMLQQRHAILRNYPIIGHFRFLFESIRPEIRQYFIESDTERVPFSREQRAIVYQRAKGALDKRPFGSRNDVYVDGFEWINHSVSPSQIASHDFRVQVGPQCAQPYSASVFNISAMSFGSLSANAVLALNQGARLGGFAHDTGEGSISRYHREPGGDLIWELGSGYFGARNPDGSFSAQRFAENANTPQVKMVELKLSQGAKPGHGGVLPAPKVTLEIAEARGVEPWKTVESPATHSAFSTPVERLACIAQMRALSGGKPAGFKLAIGHPWEFFARRESRPSSLSLMAKRAVRVLPRSNSWTEQGCPCTTGCCLCITPWWLRVCVIAFDWARRARSSRPSTSRVPWPWVPTGVMRPVASCSHWAVYSL